MVGTPSWRSPKTEKRSSLIQGRGLYALERIPAGEIVGVKGGEILDRETYQRLRSLISPADFQIEDDLFLAPIRPEDIEDNLLCINHSCDPNLVIRGQLTFVTLRAVAVDEELTIDYGTIDGDEDERMACHCGSWRCRGVITGGDWRLPELQGRYRGHFSPYLAERIRRLGGG